MGMERNPYQHSSLLKNLHAKLDPRRFNGISPQIGAAVGYILSASYGLPVIEELTVVYDGSVIGKTQASGKPVMLGQYDEVVSTWKYLLSKAGLTTMEWMVAESRFAARVGYVFEPLN
jgi:hypothetical protein